MATSLAKCNPAAQVSGVANNPMIIQKQTAF
jgi:hypothetical protein